MSEQNKLDMSLHEIRAACKGGQKRRRESPDPTGSEDGQLAKKARNVTELIKPSDLVEVRRNGWVVATHNKNDPASADFTEGPVTEEARLRAQVDGFIERTKAANHGKLGTVAFKFASVNPPAHMRRGMGLLQGRGLQGRKKKKLPAPKVGSNAEAGPSGGSARRGSASGGNGASAVVGSGGSASRGSTGNGGGKGVGGSAATITTPKDDPDDTRRPVYTAETQSVFDRLAQRKYVSPEEKAAAHAEMDADLEKYMAGGDTRMTG